MGPHSGGRALLLLPQVWAHHQMEVDSLNRAIWMQHMETPSSIMCAAHHRHALNSRKLARRAHLDPHSFACDDYSVGYKQWLSVTEAEGVLMSSILEMRERCRRRPWERGVSSLEELHDVIYGRSKACLREWLHIDTLQYAITAITC